MWTKQFGYRFAQGFAYGDYEQSTAKKRTKRERFLSEMEDALIEVATMRRFAGICGSRSIGVSRSFEAVKAHLKANGMAMKQGTIVDATIIAAPSSTKNKAGERDPEMHQT
jgi:hypothetical protein